MTEAEPLDLILVAEDDSNDLFLLRRLLDKAGVKNPVVSFSNGEEAIAFLQPTVNAEVGGAASPPCVIFLDIKMPRLDGFDVLRWIRKQRALKNVPVIMLSGSDEPRDLRRATELGASHYLIKHPAPEVFAEVVATFSSPQ